jgi:hypothetical protein
MLACVRYGLRAVANAGLREQMIDVTLDRRFADHQPLGDLCVGQVLRDQRQHFGFAGGEAVGELGRSPGRNRRVERVDEMVLHRGIDRRLAACDLLERALDSRRWRPSIAVSRWNATRLPTCPRMTFSRNYGAASWMGPRPDRSRS